MLCIPKSPSNKQPLLNREKLEEDEPFDSDSFINVNVQQCPTCLGKGKLSQSQADTVLALISVTDKRLRPKRTKLYLGITLLLCMVCFFLIAFFFLPRSVTISVVATNSVNIYMPNNKDETPFIDVKVTYQVQNHNYFEAQIKNINLDVYWNKYILNTSHNIIDLTVPSRSIRKNVFVSQQIFSNQDLNLIIQSICASGWKWSLLEKFVASADVYYLSRTEHLTCTYYGYTKCHNSSST